MNTLIDTHVTRFGIYIMYTPEFYIFINCFVSYIKKSVSCHLKSNENQCHNFKMAKRKEIDKMIKNNDSIMPIH